MQLIPETTRRAPKPTASRSAGPGFSDPAAHSPAEGRTGSSKAPGPQVPGKTDQTMQTGETDEPEELGEPREAGAKRESASMFARIRHLPPDALRAGIGWLALAGWLVCHLPGWEGSVGLVLLVTAFVVPGITALLAAGRSLAEYRLDVDVLMILAAGAAAVLGHPAEGALLLCLFATGRWLESYGEQRREAAVDALRKLQVDHATVLDDQGREQAVRVEEVSAGQLIRVRSNARVPLDGVVVSGSSSLDTAALTGEALPQEVGPSDRVRAGAINLASPIVVRVQSRSAESSLAQLLRLVEQAGVDRPAAQRYIQRFSPIAAWVVLGLAVLSFLLGLIWLPSGEALLRALSLMIVASPCALVISTPAAYAAALSTAARLGVLVKGGRQLEALGRCDAVAMDKTGTLTTGRLSLTSAEHVYPGEPAEALSEGALDDVLQEAAALAAASTHPLSTALRQAAVLRGLRAEHRSDLRETAGEGVEAGGRAGNTAGHADGEVARLGRLEFATPDHAEIYLSDLPPGHAHCFFSTGGRITRFIFRDALREEAGQTIRQLRAIGMRPVVLLSGDRPAAVAAVAESLGLDQAYGNLLPHEKLEQLEQLQRRHEVVMVGDGINDAAVLTRADCGVAIGTSQADSDAGKDLAASAAGVVLLDGRLSPLPRLLLLARRTRAIVRQNVLLAAGVMLVMAVLAVFGLVPVTLAVLSHEGSTVVVALNALRLLRKPILPGG